MQMKERASFLLLGRWHGLLLVEATGRIVRLAIAHLKVLQMHHIVAYAARLAAGAATISRMPKAGFFIDLSCIHEPSSDARKGR